MAFRRKTTKLPPDFKPLLWSYRFDKIDLERDKERIIINTINYGSWSQWQWLVNFYGKERLKRLIREIPKSEFRNYRGLGLVSLILGIKKMKYENRGLKIQAERGLARA